MSTSPTLKYNGDQMFRNWTAMEGHVVDGKFALEKYLGGSEQSGVFLTHSQSDGSRKAAIKLVAADPRVIQDLLARWKMAKSLVHPHLIRLSNTGTCTVAGENFAYVVMEYAEEDLAMITPSRALTADETQKMLLAVLEGLGYIHAKGLVHGHLKLSNIMAANERVKISSDGISEARSSNEIPIDRKRGLPPETAGDIGSAAGDVLSVGVILVEALTQQKPKFQQADGEALLPEPLPMPFRKIAGECLRSDPKQRPTIAEIIHELLPAAAAPAEKRPSPAARFGSKSLIAIVALIAAIGAWMLWQHRSVMPKSAQVAPSVSGSVSQAPLPVPENPSPDSQGKVVHQVLPNVSTGALHTIQGTIRVKSRLAVDSSGAVTSVRLESAGPSRYFARKASEAAGQWRFEPPLLNGKAQPSEWKVEFQFKKSGTSAHVFQTITR